MQIGINLALTQRNGGAGAPALNIDFAGTGVLPSTVTFSRGTNATLTGSNGLIQYAPHNLLTNSEDFEAAAWTKVAATVTANATVAPDGTTTADFLQEDTTTSTHNVALSVNFQAVPTTASVYVRKTSTRNAMIYMFTASGFAGGVLDVATGTSSVFAGSLAGTTTSVTDAGLYWRVSVTATMFALAGQVNVYAMNGSTASYTGNGTSGIFIWGAQLNVGSTAQSYNSTTPKNLLGFTQEPENAAWTKSNSYVQQNLLTWSQDFDNAAWGVSATAINRTANTTTAPDGSLTADSATGDGTNALHYFGQAITLSATTTYTLSFYAKANGVNFVQVFLVGGTGYANFNITASGGAVGTSGAPFSSLQIQDAGNGWYRCSCVVTNPANNDIYFALSNSASATRAAASFATSGGIFLWGAQLVQGSTAGDYTQTTSAAAPTRYLNWDGTLTGRKLVEDTVNAFHGVYTLSTLVAGTRYTQSVYAKAGERQWMMMAEGNNVTASAWFNLSTGVVGTVSGTGTPTATITNVGGGWYRCSLSYTPIANAGNTQARATTGDNVSTYTGDGTSGIYVSDFQLANSASVDPYVYNPQAAAASAAFYGPRFDYDPVTLAAKGLLIEEQRTNLLTYSEQFDNAAWTKVAGSVSVSQNAVGPNGVSNSGATVTALAGTNNHWLYQSFASTAIAYSQSVYAKAGTASWIGIGFGAGATTDGVFFNLSNGTVGTAAFGSTGNIQNVGNGWYRCTVTRTGPGGTYFGALEVHTADNQALNWNAAGTETILVFGLNMEAGSFATSYIPTVASQVTRNADSASMLGDNFYTWYNPNQGTFYNEWNITTAISSAASLDVNDGTTSNRFNVQPNTGGTTRHLGFVSGSALIVMDIVGAGTGTAKDAFAYIPSSHAASRNGSAVATSSYAGVPAGLRAMNIGSITGGANILNGTIRRIGYYNTRLPDSTLQALTV